MRLTELARSDSWRGARADDGLSGLLAPTPVVVRDDLFLVVGRRDAAGASKLWALRVRGDLGDAELLPMPLDDLPHYCRNGLVPTDARWDGGKSVTVLFSGFRTLPARYQLLTGAARGELDTGAPMAVDPLPMLPPLPDQDVLRASATFSRSAPDALLYAAGAGWVELGDRAHPVSHLRRKPVEPATDPGEQLLEPHGDEFALTRPVELVTPAGALLFFSRRMRDGRYIQGLARREAGGPLVRCDDEFAAAVGNANPYMYACPFRWNGRTLAALATSRLGEGGVVLAEFEDVA